MDGFVGGETRPVSDAGVALRGAARSVRAHADPFEGAVRAAGQASGCAALATALDRCAAAWQQTLVDLATQTDAVGVLADVGSADLTRAADR